MAGGGQMGEVSAVGLRRQGATAHVAAGSLSQRPKGANGMAGVRRQLATQGAETVSVTIHAAFHVS